MALLQYETEEKHPIDTNECVMDRDAKYKMLY